MESDKIDNFWETVMAEMEEYSVRLSILMEDMVNLKVEAIKELMEISCMHFPHFIDNIGEDQDKKDDSGESNSKTKKEGDNENLKKNNEEKCD